MTQVRSGQVAVLEHVEQDVHLAVGALSNVVGTFLPIVKSRPHVMKGEQR